MIKLIVELQSQHLQRKSSSCPTSILHRLRQLVAGRRARFGIFSKSSVKQNQHHYTAYCNACTLNGCRIKGTVTGKADSMRPHLASCQFVSAGVRQWAKSYTKDSGPYSEDTAESLDEQQASSQSGLNRFMSLKDTELTDDETATLHMLLLKGTISANLPFSWIDNPYIKAVFECLRPKADLPSRRQLSGLLAF